VVTQKTLLLDQENLIPTEKTREEEDDDNGSSCQLGVVTQLLREVILASVQLPKAARLTGDREQRQYRTVLLSSNIGQ
jgi:hypothetical protein